MAAVRLYRVTSVSDNYTKAPDVVYVAAIDFADLSRHLPGFPGAAEIAQVELLGDVIRMDERPGHPTMTIYEGEMICPNLIRGHAGDLCPKCGDGPCKIVGRGMGR